MLARAEKGPTSQEREDLLREWIPLVLRTASQVTGRFVRVGRDEEVSIGLMALNEAVDRFDPSRGTRWISFAEMVIRRRIIDFLRRQQHRRAVEVPISDLEAEDDESGVFCPAEDRAAVRLWQASEAQDSLREECARYAARLQCYGISLSHLAARAPKHADARQRALQIASIVAADPLLLERLCKRRELHISGLRSRVPCCRKTLERHRQYIIAATVLMSEFPALARRIGGV